ncbi:MAG: hypothetical protein AB7K09_17735 [Planctomycetota bacterium]
MTTLKWKEGMVIRLWAKGDLWTLAQMLLPPYLFFWDGLLLRRKHELPRTPIKAGSNSFCCPILRQVLNFCCAERAAGLSPIEVQLPEMWIDANTDWEEVTVFRGSPIERTFGTLGGGRGGALIRKNFNPPFDKTIIIDPIDPEDFQTIDGYECDSLWGSPRLNERLWLSSQLGKLVDPFKDMLFGRDLPPVFQTFVRMSSGDGDLEDWGYGVRP